MALVGGLYLFRVSGRLFGRDDDAREVKHGVPTIAEPLIESGQVGDAQLFAARRPLAPLKAIITLATFAGAIALAAFNGGPIAAAAFTGAVLLMLLRVLRADEAYSDPQPAIPELIAGRMVIGIGMERRSERGRRGEEQGRT